MTLDLLCFIALMTPICTALYAAYRILKSITETCHHEWFSPAFRVRVCSKCARREILMRSWEFDGYDEAARAAIAKAGVQHDH